MFVAFQIDAFENDAFHGEGKLIYSNGLEANVSYTNGKINSIKRSDNLFMSKGKPAINEKNKFVFTMRFKFKVK